MILLLGGRTWSLDGGIPLTISGRNLGSFCIGNPGKGGPKGPGNGSKFPPRGGKGGNPSNRNIPGGGIGGNGPRIPGGSIGGKGGPPRGFPMNGGGSCGSDFAGSVGVSGSSASASGSKRSQVTPFKGTVYE